METIDNVYFVEEVIPNFTKSQKEPINYSVVLVRTTLELTLRSIEDNLYFIVVIVEHKELLNIHEGEYLYFNESSVANERFSNANQNRIAKRNVYWNNNYRGKLKKKILEDSQLPVFTDDAEVFSYHVNVGHGNCSLIVVNEREQTHLWMVDCSNYDFRSGTYYQTNIDDCFDYISNKFGLNHIFIERFFLTHSHFDHYSGIPTLIRQGKITNQTHVFLNPHYSMPSIHHTRMIERIEALGCPIIEPIPNANQNGLEFWHPQLRTIRVYTERYAGEPIDIQPQANNSSTVFQLKIGRKAIVFTGDIETIRWNTIISCPCFLKNSDYFVISHHGSINGHLRNECPLGLQISNMSHCTSSKTTSILMGRDGAFNGIYSPEVIHDFLPDLLYSERDDQGNQCRFLEIDWNLNSNNWY